MVNSLSACGNTGNEYGVVTLTACCLDEYYTPWSNIKQSRHLSRVSKRIWLDFTMVVYEKIHSWNPLPVGKSDTSDICRFSNRKWVSAVCSGRNLWISEASTGVLEKFQCSSDLPNANYNCVVLFLGQVYWLFIYAAKYISSHTTIVNCNQNFWILSKMSGLFDVPLACYRSNHDADWPIFAKIQNIANAIAKNSIWTYTKKMSVMLLKALCLQADEQICFPGILAPVHSVKKHYDVHLIEIRCQSYCVSRRSDFSDKYHLV